MSINNANIAPLAAELLPGQRVVIVDNLVMPVGIGGNFEPGKGNLTDLSFVTAGAEDILEGEVSVDKNGTPVYGTIKRVIPVLNGNVFSLSAGYVADNVELNVPEAVVEYGENNLSVSTGYLDEELKIDFPEIEYAYVDAYGAVRKLDLSGDAPADTGEAIQCEGFLFALPDNIPAYPGTGLYYRCESVDTVQKSWQGRKFHGNDTDGWTLGEDIVVLKYANTIPQPGKIYNAAATLEVEALYLGFSAEELLQTRTITLCSLSDGDSFVKTSNNVNDPDASATDPGETVPYLAALLNGQTPLLVSDKENGATFHSDYFKSDKVSTVRTFEFEGNTYYYGTFDSTLVITDEKQSLPQLNHIEPLDAARLMLEQFFWLGGSF